MGNNNVKTQTILKGIKVKDMVQVSLMAAVVFVATYALHIPVGTRAVMHLGDSMIFVAAIIFGKRKAALASAIGMGLFDLLSPYIIWAPFTFVIKGGMGYIAAIIAYRRDYKGLNILNNVFAFAIAGIWMVAAYYLAGIVIYSSFIVPLGDILPNIIQVIGGAIIATPLAKIIKQANIE